MKKFVSILILAALLSVSSVLMSQETGEKEEIIPEGLEKEVTYYNNGNKETEGFTKNGEKHGKWSEWYETGEKRSELEYTDGKKNGPWIEWHENGKRKSQGTYANDEKDGKWFEWYENG